MSAPLLGPPLNSLHMDVQQRIWDCVKDEDKPLGADGRPQFTARGIIAVLEATKRHAPEHSALADFMLAMYAEYRRQNPRP